MKPIFYNRDFSSQSQLGDLRWSVDRLEYSLDGGCKYAIAKCEGSPLSIWGLTDYLRRPVKIYGNAGEVIWWGYVYDVIIDDGAIRYGYSLRELYNRVRIYYDPLGTMDDTVGDADFTAWAITQDSVDEYGYHELLEDLRDSSQTIAEQKRDVLLERFAYPHAVAAIRSAVDKPRAELRLYGWWNSINNRYVSVPPVDGVDNQDWDAGGITDVGATGAKYPWVSQSFLVGAVAVTVREITLSISTIGTNTHDLTVGIYATSSGSPTGATLGDVTITAAELSPASRPNSANVITKQFTGIDLTAATTYCIRISKGTLDAYGYYRVCTDTDAGYADGILKSSTDGAAWSAVSPAKDMCFILRVDNEVGTARQINDLISSFAEFITDTEYSSTTVEQSSYQDGTTKCLEEIELLMEAGGANGRRLTAVVDSERRLSIDEEPAESDGYDYMIDKAGRILYPSGQPVQSEMWRVPGHYAILYNVAPALELNTRASVGLQFIEEVIWTPRGMKPVFRGQPTVDDLLEIA